MARGPGWPETPDPDTRSKGVKRRALIVVLSLIAFIGAMVFYHDKWLAYEKAVAISQCQLVINNGGICSTEPNMAAVWIVATLWTVLSAGGLVIATIMIDGIVKYILQPDSCQNRQCDCVNHRRASDTTNVVLATLGCAVLITLIIGLNDALM